MIDKCLSSTSMQILSNGAKSESFRPTRGIRQGDPLSPYIFVLCVERLAQLIQVAVHRKEWKPVQLSKNGPGISYLFFANDLLLFGEASLKQVEVMLECLNLFYGASGE